MIIRPAVLADIKSIFDFIKIIAVKETNNVISLPEEFSLTMLDQEKWVKYYTENEYSLLLVAEADDKIVGVLDFKNNSKIRLSHSGEFGISILPEFQDKKIGSKMIEYLITWARSKPKLKKINLSVFESNKRAIHVYENLGFRIEGQQKNAVQIAEDVFIDLIQMGMVL
ncbi:MAG: GNAT family N-acetyltransferase [Bacteroidia bacterium]|jgi:RimJ/RimL family protein N-acetyltransferase|nr:GNAT family N-acetyltransferase [Bacteroidota bacterium]MBK7429935.1 GNAT family N-acetyltransferase [Bacteroidota bacterium]MBP9790788.1 GNAT family N-acetyltransferase [Bacteroidia bacterium]MBP9923786.1 GNAT family N-acetyltransferase [Bacteroidia bacterium]HQV99957.1 GNAT family N-acetyltransferase [Bacteroidia bacterium]